MWPEALPPFIIIASCIAFTGMALSAIDRWKYEGRSRRFGVDDWTRKMMKRDKRLTGSDYKQREL